jgi:hypothetical protein
LFLLLDRKLNHNSDKLGHDDAPVDTMVPAAWDVCTCYALLALC